MGPFFFFFLRILQVRLLAESSQTQISVAAGDRIHRSHRSKQMQQVTAIEQLTPSYCTQSL